MRISIALLSSLCLFLACTRPAQNDLVQSATATDERLSFTIFAQDPEIVTPIGIAVDSRDRIFVLESHTHLPPKDYDGPDGDRVKVFIDEDDDGRPEHMSVFASGLKEGLNLAFSPDGVLYVVTSRHVFALYDHDNDGVSETRKAILTLTEPESVYAHSALLGITFSSDGWMYVSRGNTTGASWKLEGTDGSSCSGYGDGGNIVRARPDGSGLEEIATGFWNPVDLKFDEQGHLMAADNDPDSRGPNRLTHIVRHGDYGYKSLYGGSGIHPYLAWNGELPTTLPYAVGLGEAPSGLLNANQARLPPDYADQMLATIWEESRIVRIALSPQGISVTGNGEVIVEGDADFRPVAMATDSRGNIFVTDWVLRDYPNHGKGKIWKLTTRKGADARIAKQHDNGSTAGSLPRLLDKSDERASLRELKVRLKSPDPFVRHLATNTMAQFTDMDSIEQAVSDGDADVRLGAAIALKKSGHSPVTEVIGKLLTDPDERLRKHALIWIGEQGITAFSPQIKKALKVGKPSASLFEVYLETVRHLSPEFISAFQQRSAKYSKSIPRELPPHFLENFLKDESNAVALRALALRYLDNPADHISLLVEQLEPGSDTRLQLEAIRSLAAVPGSPGAPLAALALDRDRDSIVRCEALLGLGRQPYDFTADAITLLSDPEMNVALEAVRYLRTRAMTPEIRSAMESVLGRTEGGKQEALREQLMMALGNATPDREIVTAELESASSESQGPGDADRGRRVFFSTQSMCSACHIASGRGGDLGPDLTQVAQSKNRQQLLSSILRPADEVSPEYQGWFIRLKSGETFQGRQIDVGYNDIELYTHANGNMQFRKADIEHYGMVKGSLMPEGLEKNLTVSDLRDLLAFLEAMPAD